MSDSPPDYTAIDPPSNTAKEDFTAEERRAAILQDIIEVGSPQAVKQRELASKFDVHESTISRDMDELRESVSEHLGTEAKLTTRTLFEHVVEELLEADDWRATARAWEIVQDWNDWLADLGEQHREPRKSAVEVDMRSHDVDVAYRVIRPSQGEELPRTSDGSIDHEALGFAEGPGDVEVTSLKENGND